MREYGRMARSVPRFLAVHLALVACPLIAVRIVVVHIVVIRWSLGLLFSNLGQKLHDLEHQFHVPVLPGPLLIGKVNLLRPGTREQWISVESGCG